MERLAGIEPALSVWETEVLPLNDSRVGAILKRTRIWTEINHSLFQREIALVAMTPVHVAAEPSTKSAAVQSRPFRLFSLVRRFQRK
jgi:hypothetical protein